MFQASIFSGIEMALTSVETGFCALEYAGTQPAKTEQRAFESDAKQSTGAVQVWKWYEKA